MKHSCKILLLFTLFFISALGLTLFFSDKAMAIAKSHEYGDVEMSQAGQNKSVTPVTFRHWTHRDKYTCRLCHVDLEFAQWRVKQVFLKMITVTDAIAAPVTTARLPLT